MVGSALRELARWLPVVLLGCASSVPLCDIVLLGGRGGDPETQRDEVANVYVRDGRIEAVGATVASARVTVEVSGLVVAPGFIDLPVHG